MEILGKDEEKLDELFFNFARGNKFKQCPYCKNWVEKNEGCDHIACRCGNDFCYLCGKGMNDNIYEHVCNNDDYYNNWNYNNYNNNNNDNNYNNNYNSEYISNRRRKNHNRKKNKRTKK